MSPHHDASAAAAETPMLASRSTLLVASLVPLQMLGYGLRLNLTRPVRALCSRCRIPPRYSCMNEGTLSDLKTDLGFEGWVVSDWGADHDSAASLNAGMDMSMGGSFTNRAKVIANVSEDRIDAALARILRPMIELGVIDHPERYGNNTDNVASKADAALARRFAAESTVLLKNDGVLPLSPTKKALIAVVGDANTVSGGGSGSVRASYVISTATGIIARGEKAGASATQNTAEALVPRAPGHAGCRPGTSGQDLDFNGFDLNATVYPGACGRTGCQANSSAACCAICSNISACKFWSWNGPNSPMCFTKSAGAAGKASASEGHVSGPIAPPPPVPVVPPRCVQAGVLTVCNHSTFLKSCGMGQCDQTRNTPVVSANDIAEARGLARRADVIVINVALAATEGFDRDNISLGDGQNRLVAEVASVSENVVVVVRAPGAVQMPWASLPSVRAIVLQLLPGQEAGNALADVMFGDINPGAKLPLSFPNDLNEIWLTSAAQYPGLPNNSSAPSNPCPTPGCNNIVTYTEGLEIGYRWYDAKAIKPLFEFGFGLSYTTFEFSALSVAGTANITASFTVKNTGSVAGAEVAQLYVGKPAICGGPPKQLMGFAKVTLDPGAQTCVTIRLPRSELAIWAGEWVVKAGEYDFMIGASSADIRLSERIRIET